MQLRDAHSQATGSDKSQQQGENLLSSESDRIHHLDINFLRSRQNEHPSATDTPDQCQTNQDVSATTGKTENLTNSAPMTQKTQKNPFMKLNFWKFRRNEQEHPVTPKIDVYQTYQEFFEQADSTDEYQRYQDIFAQADSTDEHQTSYQDIFAQATNSPESIYETDIETAHQLKEQGNGQDFVVENLPTDSEVLKNALDSTTTKKELLSVLVDVKTCKQLEIAFQDGLKQLERITDCKQPTPDQIRHLDSLILKMQEDLVQMRQAMTKAFTTQKRTEQQFNQAQTAANNWQSRVQSAVQKGNENLAREGLVRRKGNADIASTLRSSLDWQTPLVDNLKRNIIDLEAKISEVKARKKLLIALIDARTSEQLEKTFQVRLQELEKLADYEEATDEQIQNWDMLISDMKEDLVNLRQTFAKAINALKSTYNQYILAQSGANNWQRRAQMAVQKGNENLEQEALLRKQVDAEMANNLKIILDLQYSQADLLKRNLTALEIILSAAKAKKDILKVQTTVNKANQQLRDTLDRWANSSVTAAFESAKPELLMIESSDDNGSREAEDLEIARIENFENGKAVLSE